MFDISELNKMSLEELKQLNSLVVQVLKFKHGQAQASMAIAFNIGDKVVLNGKRGRRLSGVVTKVNHKTVQVNCGVDGMWNCAPSLLQKEAQV